MFSFFLFPTPPDFCRHKVMKHWGLVGGLAAALAASIYVLWGPIAERKKRRKGFVPGLLNLGNTCFMNSLLQCLSACPSFIKWLEEFTAQYKTDQNEASGRQYLSLTLLHLLKALSCQEATEDDVLDASCFLEVLRLYRWQISLFEEQDAHELFHVLTSSLEDERERQPRVTHLFDVHALEVETNQKEISCRTRGSLHPMSSQWKSQHPFHGRLTSNMVCKHCEHQSPVRYDTFDSLSLSIPAASWGRPLTLDHCLHHFISSESVKDVVCDNCTTIQAEGTLNGQSIENQKTTFVKQLKLGKLPQCLCIHLQRLSWSNHGTPLKRHEHVQFNEFLIMDIYKPCSGLAATYLCSKDELNLGKFGVWLHSSGASSPKLTYKLISSSISTGSPVYLYRLTAVVVHHGDMHSGHFVTYRRIPPSPRHPLSASNQWLWISDDTVRKVNLQEVLSSSAYLLFYERVHSKPQHHSRELRTEE
uniref:Ubiquitin carboxyl-terminal hydrolase n=1 Tax=Sphenodon punctatus TaxID=8508 RepID=A0A8D0GU78_SPHPU